jgi:uncharacterized protein (UPF0303 family)
MLTKVLLFTNIIGLDEKTNQFEESSLSVKNYLKEGNMTLEKTFGLNEKDFLAKGDSNAGMIATITVSGQHDEDDYKLIIDALQGKHF